VAPRVSHFVVRAATPQQQENYTYIHTTEKLGFLNKNKFNFIAFSPARFYTYTYIQKKIKNRASISMCVCVST